jgi:chromosome segregation ATPase
MKHGTICSKHDEIYKLADKISDLVQLCKDDGINMERGLDDKRTRIQELEAEVESLKDDLKSARDEIDDLKDQLEDATKSQLPA